MRILETLFLTLLVFSFFHLIIFKNKKVAIYLPLAATIIGISSMTFEGFRVHIVPAFIFSMMLLIFGIIKTPKIKFNKIIKFIILILLIPILALSVTLPFLFPVVNLPKPKGSYQVGTMLLSFSDSSRMEQFSSQYEHRNIPVQVWYPSADTKGKRRANWINSREALKFFSQCKNMPDVFDNLTLVKTNSYLNATISEKEKKYPVILFSGGAAMFNGQNIIQMEELASHGYIVFAVGHPYDDFACIYPDGRIIPYSKKQYTDIIADGKNAVKIAKNTVGNTESPEYIRTLLRNAKLNNNSVKLWSMDMRFIINEITEINNNKTNSTFYHKLDIDNIGALGHSFGGAAVGQLSIEDNRVKAFINMDGSPFGDAPDKEIIQPFMILTTEKYGKYIRDGYSEKQKNFFFVQIRGAEHMNFSDFNSLMPVLGRFSGFLGDIKEDRQIQIMNTYILNFFDKYLKDKKGPLLDAPSSRYPEVNMSVY